MRGAVDRAGRASLHHHQSVTSGTLHMGRRADYIPTLDEIAAEAAKIRAENEARDKRNWPQCHQELSKRNARHSAVKDKRRNGRPC